MKFQFLLTSGLLALIPAISPAQQTAEDSSWVSLWNGEDLAGWTTWLNKPHRNSEVPGLKRDAEGRYLEDVGVNRNPLEVFRIVEVDGAPAIRISGEIFGELRSDQSFENYHLSLEFKWGEKKWPPRHEPETPRDSGLLYHAHSKAEDEDRNWSRSIEMQIQEGDCGDLYSVGSAISVRARYDKSLKNPQYVYDRKGIWTFFSQIPGQSGRCIKSPDAEKPTGEWNTLELVCLGDEAIHIVNGQVVMRLHGPLRIDGETPHPVTSGPIILQSEGAEIFYRNIRYRPIRSVPDAYR